MRKIPLLMLTMGCFFFSPSEAQFLKKLKEKANQVINTTGGNENQQNTGNNGQNQNTTQAGNQGSNNPTNRGGQGLGGHATRCKRKPWHR